MTIHAYLQTARAIYRKHYPDPSHDNWDLHILKRYYRIVHNDSAHSFVDIETGDIFKPAGFTKPAKHARGNINAPDFGASCLGPFGPHYLR